MSAYHVKLYLATLGAFLLIDLVWLGLIARPFYRNQIGHLLAPTTNWAAAVAFYLLFVGGLLVIAVLPGLKAGSPGVALRWGALYGLLTYATYDLTNLATLRDWPLSLTLVDILWGVVLATAVAGTGFLAGGWLAR